MQLEASSRENGRGYYFVLGSVRAIMRYIILLTPSASRRSALDALGTRQRSRRLSLLPA